jgi:hypothetical protein
MAEEHPPLRGIEIGAVVFRMSRRLPRIVSTITFAAMNAL